MSFADDHCDEEALHVHHPSHSVLETEADIPSSRGVEWRISTARRLLRRFTGTTTWVRHRYVWLVYPLARRLIAG